MSFLQKNSNTIILTIAFVFLFFDFKHSTLQYSKTPLDGDFANIVLPVSSYQEVLNDPFGLKALCKQEKYSATNRFTAHYVMKVYFDHVPFWLQKIYNPIESLFASVTLAKMLIHLGFLSILSLYLASYLGFTFKRFIIFTAILSPFLIVNGPYGGNIGFIDFSMTYAFFYTLPIIFLMLFYFPIYRYILGKEDFKNPIPYILIGSPFLLFLVFFGPLSAPLLFLINGVLLLFFLFQAWKNNDKKCELSTITLTFKQLNKIVLYFLLLGIFLSFYSFYIGTFNVENDWCTVPLVDRFKVLPIGIFKTFFSIDLGALLFILFILVNFYIVIKHKPEMKLQIFTLLAFIGLFVICYCLLLPFGGCRSYRPYILRSDTFVPVLTVLLFLLPLSSFLVVSILKKRKQLYTYLFFFGALSIYFLSADKLPEYTNDKEKKALYFLAHEDEKHKNNIEVPYDCTIVSWTLYDNFEQSKNSSLILYKYGITKNVVLFKN
jgi:hypothetical protein